VANLNNPAGRLKVWVDRFVALSNTDIAISEALCRMLDVEHDEVEGRVEAMRVAAKVADLAAEVRVEAALLPDYVEPGALLEDFAQFDRMLDHFTLARQTRVTDMLGQLDAAAHRSLDLLDRQLSRFRPQPELSESLRVTLLDKVRALRQEVYDDASLDADLNDFLLRRFADVEAALVDAQFDGAAPVEVVTESIIGSIRREPKMWQRIAESTVAGTVSSVVTALFLSLVTPPAQDALPPGTPTNVINNYVIVQADPPKDGMTPDVIEGVIAPDGTGPKGLLLAPEEP